MPALIVHGGAWNIPDALVLPHRRGVESALMAGWRVLNGGGAAVDAVETAIREMEDDETFDAGRGSFLNEAGEVELDAAIMNGRNLRAGAVAAVQTVRNPITLARAVMEKSEHVLLVGKGAVRFARENGMPMCKPDDLIIQREVDRWRAAQNGKRRPAKDAFRSGATAGDTVGAVAVDRSGNLAAGTSTGGTPNKPPGRVGDSPLIGCGTYADNEFGAVSATGWGESLIRVVMAKTVAELMARFGGDAASAAEEALRILVRKTEGYGGVIALNRRGEVGISYNTPRMARAYITTGMSAPFVAV
jgi:beta-aspartyl-peptidase (threonine type)